jgi:hypothetical protein
MKSFKLCKVKSAKDMELINKIQGIDTSQSSEPSKIVFTLAKRLLKLGYIIDLDNCNSSSELSDNLNNLDIDVIGTIPNRKEMHKVVIGKTEENEK